MQIRLPKLHVAQERIVAEAARFNILCCGRRFGKTTLALDRLLRHALAGMPTAWFAPNYRLLAATWRDCLAILGGVVNSNRNDKLIEFPGGGSLEFWSLQIGAELIPLASIARNKAEVQRLRTEAAELKALANSRTERLLEMLSSAIEFEGQITLDSRDSLSGLLVDEALRRVSWQKT